MNKKGFTLIEIIVVVTLIGILTAIVLNYANNARVNAIDAKVMSEMDGIAKRANIEEPQTRNYHMVCGSGSVTQSAEIVTLIDSINTLASTSVVCNSEATAYAVSVGLSDTHWCIDSTGAREEISAALTTGTTACP